jgi:hypothetical protein
VQASERFWSATIAAVLVTGEIARELGIVTYDIAAIKQWAYDKQVPQMRGIVKEEYQDPLGILTDYLEHISSNMIVIAQTTGIGGSPTYVVRKPSGALLAHYERRTR